MTVQTDNISNLIDVLKAEGSLHNDDVRQAVVNIILENMNTANELERLDEELKRVAVFFERAVGVSAALISTDGPDGKEWPANWWNSEDFEGHKVGQISFVSDSI